MLGKLPTEQQQVLWSPPLETMLNPDHQLVKLAKRLPWERLEAEFAGLYAADGRPSIPIRVMVSLIMLQRMFDVSDEAAVKQWVQNPYWQHLSGMTSFQWEVPCDPTELVKFRKRIGREGAEKILHWTIECHQADGTVQAQVVVIDSTVQEKNVMVPRDHKLYRRIAERLLALAASEAVRLRRTYRRTIRKLVMRLRTSNFPRARAQARKAERRMRSIARTLLRDMRRKLPPDRLELHGDTFGTMEQILTQKRGGPDHVYSLHEPQTYCIGKGKDKTKYEFGTKVTVAIDPHSGVLLAAMNHECNVYDGHVTAEVRDQITDLTGTTPHTIIGDHGYRGTDEIAALADDGTAVIIPPMLRKAAKGSPQRRYLTRLMRLRARIEPVIGHLKSDHRLCRNFLWGSLGDEMNVLLAAAAWNLRKLLRFLCRLPQAARQILQCLVSAVRLEADRPVLLVG
jgi:IS5 family transposase